MSFFSFKDCFFGSQKVVLQVFFLEVTSGAESRASAVSQSLCVGEVFAFAVFRFASKTLRR